VVDAGSKLSWGTTEGPTYVKPTTGQFKNPKTYIGKTIPVEGTIYDLTDKEMSMIQERLDIDPVIDFEKGIYRFNAYLGGKKVGYFDKHTKEIKLSLSPEELEDLLRKPPISSRKEPKVYEIKI
jgi:hypothetical protein